MHLLYEYDILVNDVFYYSEHILSYIERHPHMSKIDREALSNTILDALVYKRLIDPAIQSLDLDNMCVVDNLNYKRYEYQPNVTGIPLSLKEAMRTSSLVISGSIPISVFYAKPAGRVSFCIYDMNTALSTLFSEFKFINCSYDSPTRPGQRAKKRPFLEVKINDELYLVDALTKRIYKSSWFKRQYNLVVDEEVCSLDFNDEQKNLYAKQTASHENYATFLSLALPVFSYMQDIPRNEETNYEIEESKKYFPKSFIEVENIKKDMASKMSELDFLRTSFKKKEK